MQTIYLFLFFNVIASLMQVSVASEAEILNADEIVDIATKKVEYKTHYGMGYEKRMEALKNKTEQISEPNNHSPIQVQKIHRPVRPQRPMRPMRFGR